MRLLKVALVVLVLLVNLLLAPPTSADPIAEKSPEYPQLTQMLNSLLQATNDPEAAGYTAAELQQKIANLQLQKNAMETTEDWGICRNDTGKMLAIYAHKPQKPYTNYTSSLYYLAPGQETDEDWDCDGVYLPNDVNVTGFTQEGARAVKITDGTRLAIGTNPLTNEVQLNAPFADVLKAGDGNWTIPNVTQAFIDAQMPNAPTD